VQQRIAKTQMIVVECLSLKPRQQTARYDQCLASYVTGIVGWQECHSASTFFWHTKSVDHYKHTLPLTTITLQK